MRQLFRRPSPAMVVAVLSLMVALGAVAHAAIPDPGGVIHGCFNPSTGALRVADPAGGPPRPCATSETALDWSQRGPQGAAGTQGPAGPPGPSGLSEAQVSARLAQWRPYAYIAPGGRGGPRLIESEGVRGVRRVQQGVYCIRPEANFEVVTGVAQIELGASTQRGFAFVRTHTLCTKQELEVITVLVTKGGGFTPTNLFRFIIDTMG